MKKMKIWAHRGASGYAPENTMEAFSEAVRRKADGIELDVQLTKDGEIVVIHDEKLERVSNGTGWVKDYTLKELRKLNFNKTFPEQGSARIPTLKEVYELMKKEDMLVNVELKTSIVFYEGLVDKVLDLAARMRMESWMHLLMGNVWVWMRFILYMHICDIPVFWNSAGRRSCLCMCGP